MIRAIDKLRGRREAMLVADNTVVPVVIDVIDCHFNEPCRIELTAIENYDTPRLIDKFRRDIFNKVCFSGLPLFTDDDEKKIKKVIFNDPATIVLWSDNTKTVVKCQDGDKYSKELGLAMCIAKKYLGNKGNFNETFKKYIGDEYTHYEKDKLLPIKVGTKIKIINAGDGAHGADGLKGIVVSYNYLSKNHHGLTDDEPGYYVLTDEKSGAVWRIALDAKVKIIKGTK